MTGMWNWIMGIFGSPEQDKMIDEAVRRQRAASLELQEVAAMSTKQRGEDIDKLLASVMPHRDTRPR